MQSGPIRCNRELIDTCWDVNKANITAVVCTCFELIDTCWDVNIVDVIPFPLCPRINRYMLGCKLTTIEIFLCKHIGINRYMLGCKC